MQAPPGRCKLPRWTRVSYRRRRAALYPTAPHFHARVAAADYRDWLGHGYVRNAIPFQAYADAVLHDRLAVTRGLRLDAGLRRAVIERLMCESAVDLDAIAAEFASPRAASRPSSPRLAPWSRTAWSRSRAAAYTIPPDDARDLRGVRPVSGGRARAAFAGGLRGGLLLLAARRPLVKTPLATRRVSVFRSPCGAT